MHGGGKATRSQEPISLAAKIGAVIGIAAIVLVCFVIANTAKKKAHSNTSARLELTRKRLEMCEVERRILRGEKVSDSYKFQMSQDEYISLKSENELLKEDNSELSRDTAELERFVDDLREELDQKDFISDDEAQALEEMLALGNNSEALMDLLEGASFTENTDIVVGKNELIGMLLSELKQKRTSLAQCMAEKRVVGKFEGQMLWEEMTEVQKGATLRAQVKKIALLQQTNRTEAEALLQRWSPRHYRGIVGLKEDVERRVAARAEQQWLKKPPGLEDVLDRDFGDELWNEWDWDADN